jgi:hypothetical protein
VSELTNRLRARAAAGHKGAEAILADHLESVGEINRKLRAYHDLALCPKCLSFVAGMDCDLAYDPPLKKADNRLVCMRCGHRFVGTDEQVARVERAERAWERHEKRSEYRGNRLARSEIIRAKYAAAMKGKQ